MADSSVSAREIFLYGDLDLRIIQAQSLPNMDMVTEHLRRCISVCQTCVAPCTSGRGGRESKHGEDAKIKHHRKVITSDPYVKVSVPHASLARTRVISNSRNPRWDQSFRISLAHPASYVEFEVKDNDVFGAQTIGKVRIPAETIATGEPIGGWYPVIAPSGKQPKPDTSLELEMKFTPFEKNPVYRDGITGDPERLGVRDTYLPMRQGNSVTLYQDAHISKDVKLPEVELDDGVTFEHNKCWEDICHAISEAHHLIYIVGWSVYHKVKLVREPTRTLPRGGELTLGELLKYKSEEGVRVLLLVWDDKTSHDKLFVKTAGVMQTHDEETRKFFKHSSVICILAPRYASSKLSILKQQVIGTFYTHHQKCILVDTQAHGNNRKITAFLGGLDLCDGRYDTPEHRLFRDLGTVFQDDFHNPSFPGGTKAPRQPWHDLHCKIEGPAAYDVLLNFAQRWKKATRWKEFSLLRKGASHWHDDAMIKIERISWILSPTFATSDDGTYYITQDDNPKLNVLGPDHPETWHVQIFRSIDSGSVKGFPKNINEAETLNLICAKNLLIDRSIQTAYIQAIRSAKRFIYIENQYFIGSSYAWSSYNDAGADNRVPMELAMKIVSKIRAKERFAVYIVIPMWPEGDSTSLAMQEILFWQSQTIQMMYRVVAQELKSMQLVDSNPLDYLNFFCLGNREQIPSEIQSIEDTNKVSNSWNSQRFMIYVHAKGMIVDDEYVIIGSANINERSLAGTKDTEIAMGAYQPHRTWAERGEHPHGQVYGYRMSLWAEHLGKLEKCFKEPETLECVKSVNRAAEDNWESYVADNFTPLEGHLLKYPIRVDADGTVSALPNHETFPDVGGMILGTPAPALTDMLTT